MNTTTELGLDARLQELNLNNSSTEYKVKQALRSFLTGSTSVLQLNVNPYNADKIEEWIEKYYSDISVNVVNKRADGTVDIVLRKGKKPTTIDSIDQLVDSLNSNRAVKEAVKSGLERLVFGRVDTITFNLNIQNAEKLKRWAEEQGYNAIMSLPFSDGTVNITIRRSSTTSSQNKPTVQQGSAENLTTSRQVSSPTKQGSAELPQHLIHKHYTGIMKTYEGLKYNEKLFSYYKTLSVQEKEVFLSFLWGKYMRSVPEHRRGDPDLWRVDTSKMFSEFNGDELISEFQKRLERAKRQTELVVSALEEKFNKHNQSLNSFLGSNFNKFKTSLTLILMEWSMSDNTIESILNSLSYDNINKLYRILIEYRDKDSINGIKYVRHSPHNNIPNQDLAEVAISTLLLGKMFGVDPELTLAIIGQESNFNKKAHDSGNIGMTQQSMLGWSLYVSGNNYPNILENYMRSRFKRANWEDKVEYMSPLVNRTLLANEYITMQIYTGVVTLVGKAIEIRGANTDLSDLDKRKDLVYNIALRYNGSPAHMGAYAWNVKNSPFWNLDL